MKPVASLPTRPPRTPHKLRSASYTLTLNSVYSPCATFFTKDTKDVVTPRWVWYEQCVPIGGVSKAGTIVSYSNTMTKFLHRYSFLSFFSPRDVLFRSLTSLWRIRVDAVRVRRDTYPADRCRPMPLLSRTPRLTQPQDAGDLKMLDAGCGRVRSSVPARVASLASCTVSSAAGAALSSFVRRRAGLG